MKVRVTTELNLKDLMIIGSALNTEGRLEKATHEQAVEFIERVITEGLEPRRVAWDVASKKLMAELKW